MTDISTTFPVRRGLAAIPVGTQAVVAVFVLAAVLQSLASPVTDVSWLLVVGERLLAGDRLYVDIWETNPPLAVFLYLPAVIVERMTGVAAEHVVLALVLFAVAAALSSVHRVLRSADIDAGPAFLVLAVAVLAILPVGTFGQRDHIALILEMPIFAMAAALAVGARPRPGLRILAGLMAGIAMAIKPQFALPILLAYLFAVRRGRSILVLFGLEVWAASAVVIAYALSVVAFFPDYVETILPILTETYRQARAPLVVLEPGFSGLYYLLLLIAAWRLRAARWPALSATLLVASIGFFLAFVEQGKGWPYHLYPATALALLVVLNDSAARLPALFASLRSHPGADPRHDSLRRRAGLYVTLSMAILCAAGAMRSFAALNFWPRELAAIVAEITPPSPRILAIGGDHAVGHPLTRLLGGTWVGTVACQWMAATANGRINLNPDDPELRAAMLAWIERDRRMLTADIERGRPDVILFDRRGNDYVDWARQDAQLAAQLARYRLARTFSNIDIFVRTPDA